MYEGWRNSLLAFLTHISIFLWHENWVKAVVCNVYKTLWFDFTHRTLCSLPSHCFSSSLRFLRLVNFVTFALLADNETDTLAHKPTCSHSISSQNENLVSNRALHFYCVSAIKGNYIKVQKAFDRAVDCSQQTKWDLTNSLQPSGNNTFSSTFWLRLNQGTRNSQTNMKVQWFIQNPQARHIRAQYYTIATVKNTYATTVKHYQK